MRLQLLSLHHISHLEHSNWIVCMENTCHFIWHNLLANMYFAAIRGKRALSACNRLTSIADGCADWLRCTMQFSQYYHLLGHGTTFEQKLAKTEFVSVAFSQFLLNFYEMENGMRRIRRMLGMRRNNAVQYQYASDKVHRWIRYDVVRGVSFVKCVFVALPLLSSLSRQLTSCVWLSDQKWQS